MIKYIMMIKVCAATYGDCMPEFQHPVVYNDWYTCAQAGLKETKELMPLPISLAHKLMQNTVILEYIKHATMSRLGTDMVSKAVSTIDELMTTADEDKVRFAAAKDTLDRMGLRAADKKHVHHSGGVSVNIDLG